MVVYKNECVGCELPCVEYCKYKHVPHYICDLCGVDDELDDVVELSDGSHICATCMAESDEDYE